jgi:hypothetical protein
MRRALILLPLLLAACSSNSNKGPVIASSSGQASYAVRYSAELSDATKRVADDESNAKTLSAGLDAQLGGLKKVDWNVVAQVVDDSDAAGKSADFVQARGDLESVRSFWTEEKDPITKKVAGNAQYAAQQANCTNADVAGAVSFSLNDSFDKELRQRLRGHNDAHVVIDRQGAALSKDDQAALEKLEDDVAEASYLVHVDIVQQRERVRALLADAEEVRKTLERFDQEESTYQAQAGRTEAERKASQDRIDVAMKAKSGIDAAVEQANAMMKDVDARIDAATKDYEDKLKALKDDIAQRAKSAPAH